VLRDGVAFCQLDPPRAGISVLFSGPCEGSAEMLLPDVPLRFFFFAGTPT